MRSAPLLLLLLACGNDADPYRHRTAEEIEVLAAIGPLPAIAPPDPTNRYADDSGAAALGQMLFFDKSYSGALAIGDDGNNGGMGFPGDVQKVSCQSCHAIASATLDDRRSKPGNVSLGTDYGSRNALGLVNSAFYTWTNWGGRFDSQWSLPLAVAENPKIMNSTRLQIVHALFDKYRAEYEVVFPPITIDVAALPAAGKPGAVAYDDLPVETKAAVDAIFVNYGKALAAYVRKLISREARFDRFATGNEAVFTRPEREGFRVFVESGCATCHTGPNLADDRFHVTGVPQEGDHVPAMDLGRFADLPALLASPFNSDGIHSDARDTGRLAGVMQLDEHKLQFRTKSLRDVASSGTFMHTGNFATLAQVMDFYDRGGDETIEGLEIGPLDLSSADKQKLIAFLATLEGEPVPLSLLVDTSK